MTLIATLRRVYALGPLLAVVVGLAAAALGHHERSLSVMSSSVTLTRSPAAN